MNPSNAELDLERLFYRILLIIRRFILLILIFFALGALAGWFYSTFSKKIYGSKMLISSYVLTQSYAKELVENINLFIQEGNQEVIKEKLNIDENVISNIVRLNSENGLEDTHMLEEKDRNFVQIKAQMTRPEGFKELEKGLVYYFEHSPYYMEQSAARRKAYQNVVQTIDKEIADLQVIKSQLLSGELAKKSGNVQIDLGSVILGIAAAAKQKMKAEEKLAKVDKIQLVDGFTPFSEPEWPRPATSIWLGIGMGLSIAFVIIITKLVSERLAQGID